MSEYIGDPDQFRVHQQESTLWMLLTLGCVGLTEHAGKICCGCPNSVLVLANRSSQSSDNPSRCRGRQTALYFWNLDPASDYNHTLTAHTGYHQGRFAGAGRFTTADIEMHHLQRDGVIGRQVAATNRAGLIGLMISMSIFEIEELSYEYKVLALQHNLNVVHAMSGFESQIILDEAKEPRKGT
ncbi:hypothetical protein BU15DRAFT_64929 [Melanogaster broomeanus]|nr:hypothetical protein BU15DRAFT_64929 [Melanogaster broomeanus]